MQNAIAGPPARPCGDLSVGALLSCAIEQLKGDGAVSAVAALEKLVALHNQQEDRNAAREFADALARFQSECPSVTKNRTADFATKSGVKVRYSYAELHQIARTVRPHLHKHGFSYSWDNTVDGGKLRCVCTLRHSNGHRETAGFEATVGGTELMSEPQKVKAALTFAERTTLIQVLGLTDCDEDTDGPPPGDGPETVGPGQLRALEEMLVAIDASPDSRRRFLAKYQVEALDRMHVAVFPLALADLKAVAEKKGVRP